MPSHGAEAARTSPAWAPARRACGRMRAHPMPCGRTPSQARAPHAKQAHPMQAHPMPSTRTPCPARAGSRPPSERVAPPWRRRRLCRGWSRRSAAPGAASALRCTALRPGARVAPARAGEGGWCWQAPTRAPAGAAGRQRGLRVAYCPINSAIGPCEQRRESQSSVRRKSQPDSQTRPMHGRSDVESKLLFTLSTFARPAARSGLRKQIRLKAPLPGVYINFSAVYCVVCRLWYGNGLERSALSLPTPQTPVAVRCNQACRAAHPPAMTAPPASPDADMRQSGPSSEPGCRFEPDVGFAAHPWRPAWLHGCVAAW